MNEGSIVTFYSYKGGVGRTLALANIGALLCQWGFKVLCIDWDLEAPGLHLYFRPWMRQPDHRGLTELIQAYVDNRKPRWRDYTALVHFPGTKEPLRLMSAGRQDATYVQRMQSLNWTQLYEQHELGNYLEELRAHWKESFDFILVDSRTGITDIGGICTVQLPDLLVLLFTANNQSLYGAVDVVERARRTRNNLPFDRAQLLVLPVATRFEVRIEYELAQEWLAIFARVLSPLFAEWAHRDVTASELLNFTRVPYIPYWSFGEKLPVIDKGTSDPEDIGFAFEHLAALVAQRFSYSEVLVRNRDSFVASAKTATITPAIPGSEGALRPGRPLRAFVSYSYADKRLWEELHKHLVPLKRQGLVEEWYGSEITPDSDSEAQFNPRWQAQINPHLEASDIILVLVSSDYLASNYVFGPEIRRAMAKALNSEAVLLPVIVRPADWAVSPFSQFQPLPENARPVTSWEDRDGAWSDVARGIRRIMENIRARAM